MIKLGEVYNVINNETLQIKSLDDHELYEITGNALSIDDIKNVMEDETNSSPCYVEYDDELMEMVI